MATEKLPEVPADLPPATSGVRDDVNDAFERFMGPPGLMRNKQGIPIERNLLDNEYNIVGTLKRIRNIPQWERGLGFKPGLKAEWDSFFALLPKWYLNIRERLDEKNKYFGADEDASAESREINWMLGRLSKLQTDIDFAAQEAIAPPPEPKFEPPKTTEPKAAEPPAESASKPAEPSASSAPPKASEAKSETTAAAPAAGISTTTIWAAAGILGLGALYLASRKR